MHEQMSVSESPWRAVSQLQTYFPALRTAGNDHSIPTPRIQTWLTCKGLWSSSVQWSMRPVLVERNDSLGVGHGVVTATQ